MKKEQKDSVLAAGVGQVSVTHDDVRDVLVICVSIPYLTLITHSNRTQLSLNELAPLCQNAVSQAVHSWLYEKSDSGSPLIG